MNLLHISVSVAGLTQPLSDRRDYGSMSDNYQQDRADEWKNTDDGEWLLNTTYHLQDLAENISSDQDLADLISILKEMPAKAQSILEFIE